MNKEIHITVASTDDDLISILKLQQQNLPHNISKEEATEQGFVTVEHSFDVLKRMNDVHLHVIAKHDGKVVGYALVMTKEFRNDIPVLISMFEMIDQLIYENEPLSVQNYFVMGQVCIAKDFRGLGIFDLLYNKLKEQLLLHFSFALLKLPRAIFDPSKHMSALD